MERGGGGRCGDSCWVSVAAVFYRSGRPYLRNFSAKGPTRLHIFSNRHTHATEEGNGKWAKENLIAAEGKRRARRPKRSGQVTLNATGLHWPEQRINLNGTSDCDYVTNATAAP